MSSTRPYNEEHGIEPQSIVKDVSSPLLAMANLDYYGPGGDRPRLRQRDQAEPETRRRSTG